MKLSNVSNEIDAAIREVEIELLVHPPGESKDLASERSRMLKLRIVERLPRIGEGWLELVCRNVVLDAELRQSELNTETLRLAARFVRLQRRAYEAWSRGEVDDKDTHIVIEINRYGDYKTLWEGLVEQSNDTMTEWLNRRLGMYVESKILPPVSVRLGSGPNGTIVYFLVSIPLLEGDDE